MSRPERRRASDRARRPTLASESPGKRRGSLRAELLFNLSFLAVAALLLALGTRAVLSVGGPTPAWSLAGLLVVDVLIFVLLGNALIDRLVVRPISAAVAAAEAIAAGDFQRRAAPGDTREMSALAEALNRMTDQLLENQRRLSENVRSLDETNRRLLATQRDLVQAEKMASVGRLAAGVAHEIGNPLGALMGYVSLLQRRGGADPEIVEGVRRESRRIDVIVRGLLDYSRPTASPREAVDVNASVARVLELLQAQGRLQGVELNLRLEPELPPVRAGAHLLDQLFVNLFENAARAMDGQGKLTVSTRAETYDPFRGVPVRRADDPPGVSYAHLRRPRHSSHRDLHRIDPGTPVVKVVVADTGPGIPPEHSARIFEPFFTTRPPGEGTGLGLAIVAATVADFGGRIEASSAVGGGGASFTLWLPTYTA
jgi:two-component system NtrC family sensor kinase